MQGLEGRLYHVGVVTRDLEAAMEHYRTVFGVGPYARVDTNYVARYGRWQGTVANRNAFARWGEIYLEIVEPGLGQSPVREWLETRGEGVFHLGYAADPGQRPGGLGTPFEVLSPALESGAPAAVYLDTLGPLGYWVELVEPNRAQGLMARIDAVTAGGATVML